MGIQVGHSACCKVLHVVIPAQQVAELVCLGERQRSLHATNSESYHSPHIRCAIVNWDGQKCSLPPANHGWYACVDQDMGLLLLSGGGGGGGDLKRIET